MLAVNDNGLYCAAGGFYIDPWGEVDRAVITHAHGDHARPGARRYLTTQAGEAVLRARLPDASVQAVAYGEPVSIGGVSMSLHPAGHILGSAQVRLERAGEVWVVSGDYKVAPDPTCAGFEPLRCHTFVTESTFGLPIFRWPAESEVLAAVNEWWRGNREAGKASILYAYPLGKAQRVLAGIDASIGPIYTHGAVEKINAIYRAAGIALAETTRADVPWREALIVAPPWCHGTPWMRRFGDVSTGFVSGWMRIRGTRRRRSVDRGFVFSDHADWPGLQRAIAETGAECVWVTHGYRAEMARWLEENGRRARVVETRFEGERDEAAEEA